MPVWPRVDQFMSDEDLTAAAERIKASVDWSRLPKLAAIFEARPTVNRYWHELVALTLLSLEVNSISRDRLVVIDFAERILHGSEKHRQWLTDAAQRYVNGERDLLAKGIDE